MDTIIETLDALDVFAPIKISINGSVVYNDFDSTTEAERGVYGELFHWRDVLSSRLESKFTDYTKLIVTGFDLKRVHSHHSIVNLYAKESE
jgi:hypothetical protein